MIVAMVYSYTFHIFHGGLTYNPRFFWISWVFTWLEGVLRCPREKLCQGKVRPCDRCRLVISGKRLQSGWWCQSFFIFHNIWDNLSIDFHIFQDTPPTSRLRTGKSPWLRLMDTSTNFLWPFSSSQTVKVPECKPSSSRASSRQWRVSEDDMKEKNWKTH